MMKTKLSTLVICLMLIAVNSLSAQDDTEKKAILTIRDFLKTVQENHPQARQARLLLESAKANKLSALGTTDPKLYYDFNNKYFDGKNYYSLSNGGVRILSRYAVDIKAGYENNSGYNLNPESGTAANGLAYTQISVPLLQGMITDERRTILKQAESMIGMSKLEIRAALNELFYKAAKAYLEWQLSSKNREVYKNALTTGNERLEAVKKSAALGDRPYIDTVEAAIQVQDRMINYNQADLDYANKTIQLNTFIWTSNLQPMELALNTMPEPAENIITSYARSIQSGEELSAQISNHPAIKVYDFKLIQLEAEKKLKFEKLKPQLNLSYNPLFDFNKQNVGFLNNYKWGLQFSFPLLLRKERGELKQTKIKIEQARLERSNKQNELVNKLKMVLNEYRSYNQQLTWTVANQNNYEQLWRAEKKLFDNGESSLFMMNTRENNLINVGIKVNELTYKFAKSTLEIDYSLGQLDQD